MLQIIIFAIVLVVVYGRPQQDSKDATILKYENENIGVDGYKFAFETSDGIQREEEGTLQNAGSENEAISVRGSYSYTDPSGKVVTVNFVADENGFRPQTSTH